MLSCRCGGGPQGLAWHCGEAPPAVHRIRAACSCCLPPSSAFTCPPRSPTLPPMHPPTRQELTKRMHSLREDLEAAQAEEAQLVAALGGPPGVAPPLLPGARLRSLRCRLTVLSAAGLAGLAAGKLVRLVDGSLLVAAPPRLPACRCHQRRADPAAWRGAAARHGAASGHGAAACTCRCAARHIHGSAARLRASGGHLPARRPAAARCRRLPAAAAGRQRRQQPGWLARAEPLQQPAWRCGSAGVCAPRGRPARPCGRRGSSPAATRL